MPLELNSILHNRYRITAELGRGGMGAVYRGLDESLGVEVAIKENLFVSPEAARQFEREAKLLAALRHPHLPRVTDHFVIEGQGQYLVMDFIPGENGKTLLDRAAGPLPESQVLKWAFEALDALAYLHGRQPRPVIHRDIKPGNIKITPDGRAVLVDFGLAKEHDPGRTTTTGARAYTPGFAPPEQYGIGRTDARTDLYSLGATLYALLTGRTPADGLERAMGQATLVPVRQHNPAVSEHVAQAVERALSVKPDGRFASALEFEQALRGAAVAAPAAPTRVHAPAGPMARAQPDPAEALAAAPPRRTWILPVAISTLILLGLGGGAGLVFSGALSGIPRAPEPSPGPTQTETIPAVLPTEQPSATATPPATATSEPTAEPSPTLSPTPAATPRGGGGGQIAFVSERNGLPQIFLMNVDGSDVTALTTMPDGACQPAWSPDGSRLLFVSPCRGKAQEYPRGTIFVMNPDGTGIQPVITMVGGVFDPDWSAAGIAFTALVDNRPRVWVADANGSNAHQISGVNSADRQPSWSPGGDKLVFMNTSRAGGPTLYWMFRDGTFSGGSPDQVTRDRAAYSPAWSPRGDLVAYVVDPHIWVIAWDARGFGAVQLTVRAPNADPSWSPDGQWIAFESWRDAANHEIYIMTANGGLQTRLTDHPALDYQPAWRP